MEYPPEDMIKPPYDFSSACLTTYNCFDASLTPAETVYLEFVFIVLECCSREIGWNFQMDKHIREKNPIFYVGTYERSDFICGDHVLWSENEAESNCYGESLSKLAIAPRTTSQQQTQKDYEDRQI